MDTNFFVNHSMTAFFIATLGFGVFQGGIVYYIISRRNRDEQLKLFNKINHLNDELFLIKKEIDQLHNQIKRKKNVTFSDNSDQIQLTAIRRLPESSSSSIISDSLYLDAEEEFKDFTNNLNDGMYNIYPIDDIPSDFTAIDQQLENQENAAAYEALKALYDESDDNKKNSELLWRLCRACYQRGFEFTVKDPKRKEFMFEGKKYGEEAVKITDTDLNVLKWAAACTGQSTDYMGTKEKIETGHYFKGLLDKALSIDDSEYTLLYMRGRFCYSVASLSWLERKAASAFYATPPTATYEDALSDFLKVEEIKKGEWLENLLYIGRCYYQLNDKCSSNKYLKMALECPNKKGDAEKDMLNEVQALMKKCSK
uniref:TPR_REGION domain-containing protein n=1 Tax=Parastrongyloides trichosuri TaxID=131310 RepID=A0A0N4ZRV8_PARTI